MFSFRQTTNVIPSFFEILAPNATIYPVTVSKGNLSVPFSPFLQKAIAIQGTLCPSRGIHTKMLGFAAVQGVKPITQEFPLTTEGIEEAMAKLENGELRYRAVLVAASGEL